MFETPEMTTTVLAALTLVALGLYIAYRVIVATVRLMKKTRESSKRFEANQRELERLHLLRRQRKG